MTKTATAAIFGLWVLLSGANQAWGQESPTQTTIERSDRVSPEQMRSAADAAWSSLQSDLEALRQLENAYRKTHEGQNDSTIAGNLLLVEQLSISAKEARGQMGEAITRGETEKAVFEGRKVTIASERSADLLAEARRFAAGSGIAQAGSDLQVTGATFNVSDRDTLPTEVSILDLGIIPPLMSPF